MCRAIGAAVNAGINAAGITAPNVVVVGWPSATQSAAIWGKNKSLVTIMPQMSRRDPNQYRPEIQYLITPSPPSLIATITPISSSFLAITFTGTNVPGLNIWTVAGPTPWADGATLYQTTGNETLAQIADHVAAQVELLGVSGVTASASGAVVSVAGGTPVWCNIGQPLSTTPTGQPLAVVDIGRFDQTVLITIWAPVPDEFIGQMPGGNREQLQNAILLALGGNDQRWNIAPDSSGFSAIWGDVGRWSDKAEDLYTVFRADLELEIEYSLYRPVTVTPVGVIDVTMNLNADPPQTDYVGGPVSVIYGGPDV
jgi:hypothetical protein